MSLFNNQIKAFRDGTPLQNTTEFDDKKLQLGI
jgi:hypothetical protein